MIVGIFFVGTLTKSVHGQANDFDQARAAITAAAPNINYTSFCQTIVRGTGKLVCRIQSVPTVAFLVCQQPTIFGVPCDEAIMTEINTLLQLSNDGIPTVTVNPPQINNILCGQNDSTTCSGFLETWLIGNFQHIRDSIVEDTVEDLINEVIDFTDGTGLSTTINDLTTIRDYMNVNPSQNVYRQICDLEGFFLQNGGFIVIDAPAVAENIGIDGICYDGDPTTQQVLSALNSMIMAFEDSANSASLITVSIWILFLEILIVAIF